MYYWDFVIPNYVLLGLCHPRLVAAGVLSSRLCATGALPSQIVCYWCFDILNYVLLGLWQQRLIAVGDLPSKTVSYWGFAIPELCSTCALPSPILCDWGSATPCCGLLRLCHPRLCAARILLTQIKDLQLKRSGTRHPA